MVCTHEMLGGVFMLCRRRKLRNAVAHTVTSLAMVVSMLSTVVSADTYTINYDSTVEGAIPSSYQDVAVDLTKAETYTVVLPKAVTLDGSAESTTLDYTVKAVGEISPVHYVRVIPLDDAKLYSEDGTTALDLDVTQTKRRWDSTEVETDASNTTTGVMSVNSIVPGTWIGKVRFYVTLDDGGVWSQATCTSPATCVGYDTNDNGIIDEDEKLSEPITKGKALGHKFDVGSTAFPDTCARCKKTVFAISTPEQLTAFRDAVNAGTTFAGALIELNDDIDMSENPWNTGIGIYDAHFEGVFQGNNHSIKNLKLTCNVTNSSIDVGCGFFNYLNTTVQNVRFMNCSTDYTGTVSTSAVAIVAGVVNSGTVLSNVHVNGSNIKAYNNVNASGATSLYSGVLIGEVKGDATEIRNCSVVDSSVYASSTENAYNKTCFLAGFVGYATRTMLINNSLCSATCTVGVAAEYALSNITNTFDDDVVHLNNCVVNRTGTTSTYKFNNGCTVPKELSYTNCLQVATEQCKTQAAIDILNTDNNKTWVLDLENTNNGFPIIKQ